MATQIKVNIIICTIIRKRCDSNTWYPIQKKANTNLTTESLLTVHTWIWHTTTSLPRQRCVSLLNRACDCWRYWERGVLYCGEWGTARGSVAWVGWRHGLWRYLIVHADADLLCTLHVYRDSWIAAGSAESEWSHCNDCCRCLWTGCIVGRRVVLWLWGTEVRILHRNKQRGHNYYESHNIILKTNVKNKHTC